MVKGETTSSIVKDEKVEKGKRGRRPGGFTYPHHPLKEALRLAETISKENAGAPFSRITLAKVLNLSAGGHTFRDMILSSSRYGLTIGSHSVDKLTLTDAGREIVSNTSDEQTKKKRLLETLMLPKVFQDVFNRFNGQSIPREIALKDTLKSDFSVPPEDVNRVYSVLFQNMNDYGLIEEVKGTKYLQLEKLSPPSQLGEEADKEELEKVVSGGAEQIEKPPPSPSEQKQILRQIFVAHGKSKKPLEQATKILNEYKIPYIVAIDEPHKGRPIGIKAAEEMQKCSAGIFIFTADEETKDSKGNIVMRPSDNVVYELGAGSVLYGNKIVILREEGVDLASNYDEIGHTTFEKDKLDAQGTELLKQLVGIGILKFTVG